ncbi:MAG: family 20 glycosylhydrolase, partial [Coprococcus sp.]
MGLITKRHILIRGIIFFMTIISFFLVFFNGSVMMPAQAADSRLPEENTGNMQSGILLDCARRYYSVAEIKKYIDILSENENSFLQLHLSDNENVGVECETLGQTVDKAEVRENGSCYNSYTEKLFLSEKQIREILDYANSKNVDIIPEIDMPGHMSGFFRLAEYGDTYSIAQIAVNQQEVPGELNITTGEGKKLAAELLSEYATLFKGCTYFHMGCDEYWTNWGTAMTDFINKQAEYLRENGYTVRIWNDLIQHDNIDNINKNIQIVYWSYDGATDNEQTRAERIEKRASVPELQEKGFKVIVTNNYYLYFVPSDRSCTEEALAYTVKDIEKNWTLEKWDANYEGGLKSYDNILGGMIAVWGE